MLAKVLFWIFVGIVLYIYFGYPLLLIVIAQFRKKPVKKGNITPFVSIIIAAYNEEKCIREKLENSLSLDYPKDKLEIIVASNGSMDKTDEIVSGYFRSGIKLNSIKEAGKTNVQNKTVPLTFGEIIVFSDANSIYDRKAIKKLVRNFADSKVGLVQGRPVFRKHNAFLLEKGVTSFIRYEDCLKQLESRLGYCIAGYGGILAVRRTLFSGINPNYMEDFILPVLVIKRGFLSIFEPEALMFEKATGKPLEEFQMRRRIVNQDALAFSYVFKTLLSSGKFLPAFQLFSHKFLRWNTFWMMLLIFFTNLFLVGELLYLSSFLLQSLFYVVAVLCLFFRISKLEKTPLHIPFYFCLITTASLFGLLDALSGKKQPYWEKSSSAR